MIPGVAILPLRLFLGITFLYAGIQKIADQGFLRPGSSSYIGTQIMGFSHGSPIRFFLFHLMEHAVAIGILTILAELVIAVLVLLGALTRLASLAGLLLNFGFFLSASWHSYPYFYGSDIVFVIAWLTLMLTGPGPYALDTALQGGLHGLLGSRLGPAWRPAVPVLLGRHGLVGAEERTEWRRLTRAEAVLGGVAALALIALGLVPRGTAGGSTSLAGGKGAAGATPAPTSAPSGTRPAGGGRPSAVPAGARKIGNTRQLPVNTAGTVRDPQTGDPAIIIHTSGSQFYAYDAICTHAGCTVQYDPSQKLLVCPCHGGEYDPARGAEVVAGPPPTPLTKIDMTIAPNGDIYIV